MRFLHTANFVTRIRTPGEGPKPPLSHHKPFIAPQGAQQPPFIKVSLKRSQKVDLEKVQVSRPIRSPSLEAKGLRRAPIEVISIIYLVN